MMRISDFNQEFDETVTAKEELFENRENINITSLNKLYMRFVKCSMIAMRKQDKIKSHLEIINVCKELILISKIKELKIHYYETAVLDMLEGNYTKS